MWGRLSSLPWPISRLESLPQNTRESCDLEDLTHPAAEAGKEILSFEFVGLGQRYDVGSGAVDGHVSPLWIDHPNHVCAGVEPGAGFLVDFGGPVVGRDHFDGEIGCAWPEFSLGDSAPQAVLANNAMSGARTVSGFRAIRKPVSAKKTRPKSCS